MQELISSHSLLAHSLNPPTQFYMPPSFLNATNPPIWWSNGIFFVSVHAAALLGVHYHPASCVPRSTLILCFLLFQSAEMAITVGYHRLYSHRTFRATWPLRALLALLGASAMQGSIKWWCLRHRLHHRFTDDPIHDPYAATRGILWSHMGWIFFKPRYERLELIDRDDLENDRVVRLQHQYYVPLALLVGMALPPIIGTLWDDPRGAFVWGSLVAKLLVWHCTFFVNSLAHWDGLQPFSDENTSKSNLILAILTWGEGNHNFHAFPHDYRSGPSRFDWDPSKWTILLLHALGLVSGLKRARADDMSEAKVFMLNKHRQKGTNYAAVEDKNESRHASADAVAEWGGPVWTWAEVEEYIRAGRSQGRCVLIIDRFVVDVTGYLGEHPGGAMLLRRYSLRIHGDHGREDVGFQPDTTEEQWKQAAWAFYGGLNVHTRTAKKRMREMRVATLSGRHHTDKLTDSMVIATKMHENNEDSAIYITTKAGRKQ